MFFKKTLLVGSVLATLSFSALAQAAEGLTTVNKTKSISAVRILTGRLANTCTGNPPPPIPAQYTMPGETKTVGWTPVGILCNGSPGGICKAEIHMTKNCSGPAVAVAELNIPAKIVQNVVNKPASGYNVTASGATVYFNEA